MNNPSEHDGAPSDELAARRETAAVDRAHDLVVELNPYQATLDLVAYINRSDRPLAQFEAIMSAFLAMVQIHPHDMNDVLCEAFKRFEASAGLKWWGGLTDDMRRHWRKLAQSDLPEDAYREYLETSRGQGQTAGRSSP